MLKVWQRLIALLMLFMLMASGAWAENIRLRGKAGYDGCVLFGRVNPLAVEISGAGEAFDGVVSTQVYVGTDQYDRVEMPVSVPAGETVSARIPVCSLIPQQTYDVTLRDASGSELAKISVTASHFVERATVLVGVLHEDGEALAAKLEQTGRSLMGKKSSLCALALDEDSFPQSEAELSAFDALLMDGFDPSSLSERQQDALALWLEKGGLMLLGEGEGDARTWFERQGATPELLESGERLLDSALEYLAGIEADSSISNYRLYSSASREQRVSQGVSLWPAGLLLAAYVLVVGFGLYALMRRGDRRKALWAAIPACAALTVAAMIGVSCLLGLNEPALSSVHVTVYDEEGKAYTEEHVTLSYADQTRVTIAAQGAETIERLTDRYFSSYIDENTSPAELKDIITLGDSPSIELYAAAPWVTRELVVMSDRAPQGTVEGRAYMAEDGLHAEIANLTDTLLEDAVLITGVGFLRVGDVEPGEEREIVLKRETFVFDKEDEAVISEGVLAPYTLEQSRFVSLCVYPERTEDPSFKTGQLSEAEQYARALKSSLLRMTLASTDAVMPCSLIAKTSIPCTPLTLNGKAIERMAQSSVLVKNLAFDTRTDGGWFYEPLGNLKAWSAYQGDAEAPMLISPIDQYYMESDQDILVGYDLGDIRPGDATEIRVILQNRYGWRGDELRMSIYDHLNQKWTAIDTKTCSVISGNLAQRVISEGGELFLRVSGGDSTRTDVPGIVVEGRIQPRNVQPDVTPTEEPAENDLESGKSAQSGEEAGKGTEGSDPL